MNILMIDKDMTELWHFAVSLISVYLVLETKEYMNKARKQNDVQVVTSSFAHIDPELSEESRRP